MSPRFEGVVIPRLALCCAGIQRETWSSRSGENKHSKHSAAAAKRSTTTASRISPYRLHCRPRRRPRPPPRRQSAISPALRSTRWCASGRHPPWPCPWRCPRGLRRTGPPSAGRSSPFFSVFDEGKEEKRRRLRCFFSSPLVSDCGLLSSRLGSLFSSLEVQQERERERRIERNLSLSARASVAGALGHAHTAKRPARFSFF